MEEEKRALETTHRETADGATKERAELERALDALRRKEAELAAARDAADAEALQEKKAREALEGALREVTNTSRARDVELERERAARGEARGGPPRDDREREARRERAERVSGAFRSPHAGPRTIPFARCTPFLEDIARVRVFLSAHHPTVSIPTHLRDAFRPRF